MYSTRMTRWALMNKDYDVAYALIEDIVMNNYQWGSGRNFIERTPHKEMIKSNNGSATRKH